jgi:hypothetical protein
MPVDEAPTRAVVLADTPRTVDMARYEPVITLEALIKRRELLVNTIQSGFLVQGGEGTKVSMDEADYGIMPGTKRKSLLQPGADKLLNLFGLIPHFEVQDKLLDFTGEQHHGEPFIYYEVRCVLERNGLQWGESLASGNSWEKKHRYRKADYVCPDCGKEAIRKSKPPETGFYCWRKLDGCGQLFTGEDERILGQKLGQIPNPDIADTANSILKVTCKRAKVSACISALGAHEFFVPDLEDLPGIGIPPTNPNVRAADPDQPEPPSQPAPARGSSRGQQPQRSRQPQTTTTRATETPHPPAPPPAPPPPPPPAKSLPPEVKSLYETLDLQHERARDGSADYRDSIVEMYVGLRDLHLLTYGQAKGAAVFTSSLKEYLGVESIDQLPAIDRAFDNTYVKLRRSAGQLRWNIAKHKTAITETADLQEAFDKLGGGNGNGNTGDHQTA